MIPVRHWPREPFQNVKQFPAKMLPKHMPKIRQVQNQEAGEVRHATERPDFVEWTIVQIEVFVLSRILLVTPSPNGITLKNAFFYSTMNINSYSINDDDFLDSYRRKYDDTVAAILPTFIGSRGSTTWCDYD